MVAKEIKSLQHKLVKEVVKLRSDRSARMEKGLVFVSGKKMVEELGKDFKAQIFFSTKKEIRFPAIDRVIVTESIMKKITGLPSPEPYAALFPMPKLSFLKASPLLVLDEIGDPGNLGTLFRSALGLGWKGILLTPKSVDPFHEKALRASRGAPFYLPYNWMEKNAIIDFAKKKKLTPYIADIEGKNPKNLSFSQNSLLVLSSESRGAGEEFQKSFQKITLPMTPKIESYNVAAAGSILLYLMGSL